MSFAAHGKVRVLRIDALPERRGPAAEARLLYTELGQSPVDEPSAK
jgi:ribosome-associated heat shock protein Hsp15